MDLLWFLNMVEAEDLLKIINLMTLRMIVQEIVNIVSTEVAITPAGTIMIGLVEDAEVILVTLEILAQTIEENETAEGLTMAQR